MIVCVHVRVWLLDDKLYEGLHGHMETWSHLQDDHVFLFGSSKAQD